MTELRPSGEVTGAGPANTRDPLKLNSYIHSLDGIRAIAMTIVLLSHTGYEDIIPGRAGVTIFFFLSGYLITTLMLGEFERKGTIEIKKFYGRRFIRLLPPIFIALPAIYLATAAGLIPGVANIRTFFAQLFYMANYLEIFTDNLERPAGTIILWSLAIEEHFYLLYPLLIVPLLKRFGLRQIIGVFVAICVATLAWRFYLAAQPDFHPNRTAFGTDTRADSILLGCILALTKITHINRIKTDPAKIPMTGLALFGAGAIVFLYTLTMRDEYMRETIRYTLQGLALMPLMYYPVVYHGSALFKWLENSVIKKVGVYSYVMYLVHYPLYYGLAENIGFVADSKVAATVVTFLVSAAMAWGVDRWVDTPLKPMRAKLR